MEVKKSKHEKKRVVFLSLWLLVFLSLTLVAFQWNKNETEVIDFGITEVEKDDTVKNLDIKDEENNNKSYNFAVIEQKPVFPGGNDKIMSWIGKNAKYPSQAREKSIQGTVYIGFIINKTGEVINVKVKRGADPILDAEAVRIIKSMPKWKPGKQDGKFVKVSYIVPIKFKLN